MRLDFNNLPTTFIKDSSNIYIIEFTKNNNPPDFEPVTEFVVSRLFSDGIFEKNCPNRG